MPRHRSKRQAKSRPSESNLIKNVFGFRSSETILKISKGMSKPWRPWPIQKKATRTKFKKTTALEPFLVKPAASEPSPASPGSPSNLTNDPEANHPLLSPTPTASSTS